MAQLAEFVDTAAAPRSRSRRGRCRAPSAAPSGACRGSGRGRTPRPTVAFSTVTFAPHAPGDVDHAVAEVAGRRRRTTLSPGSTRLTRHVSMPGRAGRGDRERQLVLRLVHLAQHLLRLGHDLQELRVEVAQQRRGHRRRGRAGGRRSGRGRGAGAGTGSSWPGIDMEHQESEVRSQSSDSIRHRISPRSLPTVLHCTF